MVTLDRTPSASLQVRPACNRRSRSLIVSAPYGIPDQVMTPAFLRRRVVDCPAQGVGLARARAACYREDSQHGTGQVWRCKMPQS